MKNFYTSELEKKREKVAVKIGNSPFDAEKNAPTKCRGFFVSDL